MVIVEECILDNTVIRIHDDSYKNKTEGEIDAILDRVARIGRRGGE